jgi:hypothetical protein
MIIHHPEIECQNGQVRVSANVDLSTVGISIPEQLWFEFPENCRDFIVDRSDSFAAALLVLAMALGEPMELKGKLSPRLMFGLNEYQRVLNNWFPERFKLIEITCGGWQPQKPNEVIGGVACTFSGGVDSFYTLWSHLAQNEPIPGFQISHALFVQGFDIPLDDDATYRTALDAYSQLMEQLGIQLVTARTNAREFDAGQGLWELAHGSIILSIPLMLGKLLKRFYIASSHQTYNDTLPWGSDPRLDHLLSTEVMEVFNDAASIGRFGKIKAISQWEASYDNLRVCWVTPDGLKNCGKCKKCTRTMIGLEILGNLSQYSTFPHPLTSSMIRDNYTNMDRVEKDFAIELIEQAKALKKPDIALAIEYAVAWKPPLSNFKRVKNKLKSKFLNKK